MPSTNEHKVDVRIANRMGFHVRPVQRFAEMARLFMADVEVELGGRKAPGKSVMNLMSLGGKCGDTLRIAARGEDARQCVSVLQFLAGNRFFVEDYVDLSGQGDRHLTRLAGLSSCFLSGVVAKLDGRRADAKDVRQLSSLELTPRSEPAFEITGPDAEQARAVLSKLVAQRFYVEHEMGDKKGEAD
jgi:phosphotransferase system HPr (HPr) family protein